MDVLTKTPLGQVALTASMFGGIFVLFLVFCIVRKLVECCQERRSRRTVEEVGEVDWGERTRDSWEGRMWVDEWRRAIPSSAHTLVPESPTDRFPLERLSSVVVSSLPTTTKVLKKDKIHPTMPESMGSLSTAPDALNTNALNMTAPDLGMAVPSSPPAGTVPAELNPHTPTRATEPATASSPAGASPGATHTPSPAYLTARMGFLALSSSVNLSEAPATSPALGTSTLATASASVAQSISSAPDESTSIAASATAVPATSTAPDVFTTIASPASAVSANPSVLATTTPPNTPPSNAATVATAPTAVDNSTQTSPTIANGNFIRFDLWIDYYTDSLTAHIENAGRFGDLGFEVTMGAVRPYVQLLGAAAGGYRSRLRPFAVESVAPGRWTIGFQLDETDDVHSIIWDRMDSLAAFHDTQEDLHVDDFVYFPHDWVHDWP